MILIPHVLCLLGLLALDTVHTTPLVEELATITPVLDTTSPSAEVKLQRGSCRAFWFSFNGHCYKYVASHLTWGQAELNCVSEDANLVSIHSMEEHNFVRTLIKNFDHLEGWTWIGLTDIHVEGGWMWSDGSKVGFTNWYPGMPNNNGDEHCVCINWGTKWNDLSCSGTKTSVCLSRTNTQ